ncbi:3-methyladenine DNA glycosylase [Rosistilla carotiformis]|uniref:Putative 3-methyladenine DNA glycosylase n=1 Tax=Rosistilla carotiformis TaxID=2528017 RepID=A0A518JYF8_9BACT|nr:DNA-3-methyladenine glycosylase [Rosistilla carotiformis]QDV70569.1 3-methyladenine DNA glycosylase [Rosistilla carotiformis]
MDTEKQTTTWPKPLAPSFYRRPPEIVARALIGKTLLHRRDDQVVGGVIVETEAYLAQSDPACHAARGMTPRNRTMFGPEGRLYVYTIHAKYCLNAVTQRAGVGSAVLIRAIEPRWGIEVMQQRRGQHASDRLCRGPAMLCQAMGIDLQHDGVCLTETTTVWIGRSVQRIIASQIVTAPRIGISQAKEIPLRYFVRNSPFVSGPKYWHKTAP